MVGIHGFAANPLASGLEQLSIELAHVLGEGHLQAWSALLEILQRYAALLELLHLEVSFRWGKGFLKRSLFLLALQLAQLRVRHGH